MILIGALLSSIILALLRGGKLHHIAELPIRLGWLALLALTAQIIVVYGASDRLEADRPLHAALMVVSYLALVAVVWANRRIKALPILGLGLLLNLMVMVGNGGFMPVSREAVAADGIHTAETLPADGARLPRSKDVLLPVDETRLWFLSDVIVVSALRQVYSLGDVVIAVGAFLLLQSAMVPASRKRYRKEDQMNAA